MDFKFFAWGVRSLINILKCPISSMKKTFFKFTTLLFLLTAVSYLGYAFLNRSPYPALPSLSEASDLNSREKESVSVVSVQKEPDPKTAQEGQDKGGVSDSEPKKIKEPEYYTIQVSSLKTIRGAERDFKKLSAQLSADKKEFLRIEKVQGYYTVRVGKFHGKEEGKGLLSAVTRTYPSARYFSAYILPVRIKKIFSPDELSLVEDDRATGSGEPGVAAEPVAAVAQKKSVLGPVIAQVDEVPVIEGPGEPGVAAEPVVPVAQKKTAVLPATAQVDEASVIAQLLDYAKEAGVDASVEVPETAVVPEPAEQAGPLEEFKISETIQAPPAPQPELTKEPTGDDPAQVNSPTIIKEEDLLEAQEVVETGRQEGEGVGALDLPEVISDQTDLFDKPLLNLQEEKKIFSHDVTAIIDRNETGGKINKPSTLFYDKQAQETYVSSGGRLVIYGHDYYPLLSIGRERGINNFTAGVFDRGMLYIAQSGSQETPAKITILNGALVKERDIPLAAAELKKINPHRLGVAINGDIYLIGNGSSAVLVIEEQTGTHRWWKISVRKESGSSYSKAPKGGREITVNDIDVDSHGNIYLTSLESGKIFVYNSNEEFLFSFGEKGGAHSKLSRPQGLVIDEMRRCFYVVDYMRHCVQVYDYTGRFRYELGGKGWARGRLQYPTDVALGPGGQLLVADYFNDRVQAFDVHFPEPFPQKPENLWQIPVK